MTQIPLGKSVTRRTQAEIRERGRTADLIITLHAGYLEIRPAKTRHALALSYVEAYQIAARKQADKIRADKKAAKKAKAS